MEKEIKQPTLDLQQKLDELLEATPTEVTFRGKKRMIGWLHNGTIRKFSHIMMTEDDLVKRNTKLCTVILLNNKFKILFFYWFLWRWYFYIKDLDSIDVMAVLDVAKKKVPQEPFLMSTILATGMTDLMKTMTRKEVARTHHEQHGEQVTA